MAQPAVPARLGDRVTAIIGYGAGLHSRPVANHRSIAAVACAAAVLLLTLLLATSYFNADAPEPVNAGPSLAAAGFLGVDSVPPFEHFAASVGGLLERPLATEIQMLQRQTVSAVQFLVACSGADITIRRDAL